MIGVALACAGAVSVIGWAMVTGRISAPDPGNASMIEPLTWARSLTVTFLAIVLFGWLMVAVVQRMERGLHLARQETLRREQAERERADAELRALESKQLEMVGRLAAGVAHDFNNNLTAIMGSAELLKMEVGENGSVAELSDGILSASQRLAELTRQLLAYSRKARMIQTPTDVHAIAGEAVSLVRRSSDPNLLIVTELNAGSATVAADAALLQSAIMNLLVNARDAMPEGGTLTVATTSIELTRAGSKGLPAGRCLVLEVIDTGRGIAQEQLPHIFDPFFTTKPVGKGTGLGLAAVAGTVKAHGGSIEVNSDLAQGTAFRIYLPLMEPEGQVSAPPATGVVAGEGEILLVEDDAMVRALARDILVGKGYDVVAAEDGEEALSLFSEHQVDLVLTDMVMPKLHGRGLAAALRRVSPALPIVFMSGYAHDVGGEDLSDGDAFVQKPFAAHDLTRAIRTALDAGRVRLATGT
jgi:signal transduction histidine kinase/ActR/RegA family two-component response regulator